MTIERIAIPWAEGTVSAAWHHPARGSTYLVLAHGAGGTMHTPALVQLAGALAERDIGVLRFNFPYTETNRKTPDPPHVLTGCYRAVAEHAGRRAGRLLLGGRSMGGRIASHIVADGAAAAGLVFLSYPLHPPGQPDRLRAAHLPKIRVPMLFIQGTRDAFARPDLRDQYIAPLPQTTLHIVEGADHGLRVRGRPAEDVTAELVDTIAGWIAAHTTNG